MANTTKERILAIAPELATKIQDVLKQQTIVVGTVADDTTYTININSISYEVVSGTGATVEEIISAFEALLIDIPDVVITFVGTTIYVTGTPDAISFTAIVSDNLTLATVQEAKDNNTLFEIILEDVITQVTELAPVRFEEEQERAQRYLAAHLLTLTNIDPDSGDLGKDFNKEYVGDVQYHYESRELRSMEEAFFMRTPYGEIFYDIYKRRYFRFI
jgi:hypothetical protein